MVKNVVGAFCLSGKSLYADFCFAGFSAGFYAQKKARFIKLNYIPEIKFGI